MAKNFKNPTMNFITPKSDAMDKEEKGSFSASTDVPEGFKRDPRFVETKSRHVQLLMQPSLHDKLKQLAKDQGVSLNHLIHSLLENMVDAI